MFISRDQAIKLNEQKVLLIEKSIKVKFHNQPIYTQLEELDKKKVRALSDAIAGDDTYLTQLNDQQANLRTQLQ